MAEVYEDIRKLNHTTTYSLALHLELNRELLSGGEYIDGGKLSRELFAPHERAYRFDQPGRKEGKRNGKGYAEMFALSGTKLR
jgi:hypothetical protein